MSTMMPTFTMERMPPPFNSWASRVPSWASYPYRKQRSRTRGEAPWTNRATAAPAAMLTAIAYFTSTRNRDRTRIRTAGSMAAQWREKFVLNRSRGSLSAGALEPEARTT